MTIVTGEERATMMTIARRQGVRLPRTSAMDGVRGRGAMGLMVVESGTRPALLVAAAATVTTHQMAIMVRLTSGFVQVALPSSFCNRLQIPMSQRPCGEVDSLTPGQCVAVDAAEGVGTGISAADRARTARVLSDPDSSFSDLVRPGHVVPVLSDLRPSKGWNPARTAAIAIDQLIGGPGAVYAELIGLEDPTRLATHGECLAIAEQYDLDVVLDPLRENAFR